ncbi:hypothetical protein EC988_009909 [Linderina pennispora]|nr:hypothetical protein EC988_009909 [Linderina pennispora]
MSQACQQMAEDAQAAALLNVPSGPASEVFAQPACVLPRSGTGAQRVLGDAQALETWVAETGRQTSELFAERRRLTANVQAALSVPPPKQLELK